MSLVFYNRIAPRVAPEQFFLDRTNVVESAFARKHVLTVLEHLGVHDLAPGSREALDVAFNECEPQRHQVSSNRSR